MDTTVFMTLIITIIGSTIAGVLTWLITRFIKKGRDKPKDNKINTKDLHNKSNRTTLRKFTVAFIIKVTKK